MTIFKKEIKSNFTITGEIKISTNDLEVDEKEFVKKYVDNKLKEQGISAFDFAFTTKSLLIEDTNQ